MLEVEVIDRFGSDCSTPTAGWCALDARAEGSNVGDWELDVYQSVGYVGVATNFSAAEESSGGVVLLPDDSVRIDLSELSVPHPGFRLLAVTDGLVTEPPLQQWVNVGVDAKGVRAEYRTLSTDDGLRLEPQQWSADWGPGLDRERVGPVNALGSSSSDVYVWAVVTLPCEYAPPPCAEATDDVLEVYRNASPNVVFGFDYYEFEGASDPSALEGPRARSRNTTSPDPSSLRSRAREPPAPLAPAGRAPDSPSDTPSPWLAAPAGSSEPLDLAADAETESSSALSFASAPARPLFASALVAAASAGGAALLLLLSLLFRGRVRRQGAARLLEDASRRRILDAVRARPGLTVSEIARAVGLAHTPARYHVRLLSDAGLVVVARRGGPRAFYHVFPAGAAPPRAGRRVALEVRSDAARSVAAALLAAPEGATVAGIVVATGLGDPIVRFHLRALRAQGDVVAESRGAGGTLSFALTPFGRSALEGALAGAPPEGRLRCDWSGCAG